MCLSMCLCTIVCYVSVAILVSSPGQGPCSPIWGNEEPTRPLLATRRLGGPRHRSWGLRNRLPLRLSVRPARATRRRSRRRRVADSSAGETQETTERAIQTKFVHIPSEVLETKRFDGLLVRDRIKADRAALVKGQRLGAKYWDSLPNEVGDQVEGLGSLRPEAKDHRVTPNLLRNVSCASDSVFCGSSCLDIAFDFLPVLLRLSPTLGS